MVMDKKKGVRVDLQYEKNESDICKSKMRRLEDDLTKSENMIQKLEKQLTNRNLDSSKMNDLEGKIKNLEENILQSESSKRNLEATLTEIEEERDEEMKIVQDALDEAAQEREELIKTFQKELDHANTMNTAREQQMLDDFEWKLREMQQENKKTLDEMENQAENSLHKKKHSDEDEYKIKLEKAKKELNSEWEDRLRQECARLKISLESKYDHDQEIVLNDLRHQKELEYQSYKRAYEAKEKETAEEMLNLRQLISEKEANYQKDTEDLRTTTDRDIWGLRMKLQKLNDTSYDKEQKMIEKHSEELELLRIDYDERIKEMNHRIEDYETKIGVDTIAKITEEHRKQIEHLGEQHKLSMERLREESEGEKFQCVEEARLILTDHYEQLSESLKEKMAEADIKISQYKTDLQNTKELANKRKETIQNYEEQLERMKQLQTLGSSLHGMTSSSSGIISQYSLETQSFNGSQDSPNSQDTGSSSDSGHEDNSKTGDE